MGMSIGVGIIIFIIGCLVGYLICMTSWVRQLSDDMTKFSIELSKVKAKLGVEDGNDD